MTSFDEHEVFDVEVAERFESIRSVSAPDVWGGLGEYLEADRAEIKRPRRRAFLVAAVLAMIAGLGGLLLRLPVDDGATVETADGGALPPAECVSLVGSAPWVTLFSPREPSCVIVADFQDMRIWNKGADPLTIEWHGETVDLPPDEFFPTGRAADSFEAGSNRIESTPYPMPEVWLLPSDESAVALLVESGGLEVVTPGMTVNEASSALGMTIAVDLNILSGPECWGAVIVDDPYSPTFVVEGSGDGTSVVVAVLRHDRGPESQLDSACT